MTDQLEPGSADPAALAQLHPGESGGNGDGPPPEPSGEPSIGGEPASEFVDRRQAEVEITDLDAVMADPNSSLKDRADARELKLAMLGMGQPATEKSEPEHRETLWTGAITVPDDLGEPLQPGSFTAPQNESEVEETLGTVMEGNPHFSGWFNNADDEQQNAALAALSELAGAGVPASLLSDLTKMEHDVSQSGGAGYMSADACRQSLVAGYGVEGAKRKIKQANAVINSLPDGVRERYQAGLQATGLGNHFKLVERLSDFYERGR